MRFLKLASLLALAMGGVTLAPLSAEADPPSRGCSRYTGNCHVTITRDPVHHQDKASETRNRDSKKARGGPDAAQAKFDAEWEAHRRGVEEYNRCQAASLAGNGPVAFCRNPPPPPDPLFRVFLDGSGGGQPVPAITPAQAGAIAATRLKLPTVAPGIGPSPDRNRWKMAAVGYPLWLWA